MDFRILGPLQVIDDQGREVPLASNKQRALLAILLLHANELVTTDRLVDDLWGDEPPASASKALQVHISRLRRALENGQSTGDRSVLTQPTGYLLRTRPGELDLDRFEDAVSAAASAFAAGDSSGATQQLDAALALWRGEPLADLAYEPFADSAVARLQALKLAATEQRIDAKLALGRHGEVVPELEALVREHPYREQLRAKLMLALYRAGRQADALTAYREARHALVDELGIEPGAELRELEQAILNHDPALAAPPLTGSARSDTAQDDAGPAVAPRPPQHLRRPHVRLVAAVAAVVAAALVVVLATRSGHQVAGTPLTADSQAVAEIDPAKNAVTAVASVGALPGALAFDPASDSLWVANRDDETITHIDPKTEKVGRTIPAGGVPTGIAAGSGQVWFVTTTPDVPFVTAHRIDPGFDSLAASVRVPTTPNGTASVALTRHGLWVAPSAGLLTRIDSRSAQRGASLDPRTSPSAIAVGAGATWLADRTANSVTRIDDTTGEITPVPVGNLPTGIAVAHDGVWVTLALDDVVIHLDPTTGAVTKTVPVGHGPAGVAVGLGSVWVANSGDGTVTRVEPATGATRTIAVGASPQAVAVAHDRVWVSVTPKVVSPPASRGTVRMEFKDDPIDSMDPALAFTPVSLQLEYLTCAGLLRYPDAAGAAGSRLEPDVAAAQPAVSRDGLTYTFRIRSGFRFSPPSNQPVTAQTFKTTLERTLNPRMKSPARQYLGDIAGAGAYIAGKADHISGVTAAGQTLRIRLTRPAADLPARLAMPFACPVPPDTPVDPNGLRTVAGAGPYYIASYVPDQGAVLKRNPNYRGSRPHRSAQIALTVGNRRPVQDVLSGRADYTIDGLDPATVRSLAAGADRKQMTTAPILAIEHMTFNSARPLFASVRRRLAANYAIDRTALARVGSLFGVMPARPVSGYLPPGLPGYLPEQPFPLRSDIGRARQLAGNLHARAALWTFDAPTPTRLAALVKKQLAAIGIDAQIRRFPEATFFEKLATKGAPYDIAIEGWLADYPDPSDFLTLFDGTTIRPNQNNDTSYLNDASTNALIARLSRLYGPRRYLQYGRAAYDIARRQAPWAAYGAPTQNAVVSKRTGCVVEQPIYGIDLAALCLHR